MQIKCGSDARRIAVKNSSSWNGIDYLEVHSIKENGSYTRNPLVLVYCFKPVSALSNDNILFSGGIREKGILAEWVYSVQDVITNHQDNVSSEEFDLLSQVSIPENVIVIRPNSRGDFSTYTLSLVESHDNPDKPANGFDVILSHVDFSFKIECDNKLDCTCVEDLPQESLTEPTIDYMAKDYASLRKLVLDRLSLIMPNWKERNPADIGMMLVELLAYVGDHLSYYQDAVSTEAYLGTARRRISITRHARLVDYPTFDGRNSRAWICFAVNTASAFLPKGTQLLTGTGDSQDETHTLVEFQDLPDEILKGAEVFETMYDISLYQSKNNLLFYTWGETDCWLPAGSTSATINGTEVATMNVFVWEDVPGADTSKLTSYLASNFGFDWLETSTVTNSGTVITISNGKKNLTIKLQDDIAVLEVNGTQLYLFQAVEESTTRHNIKSSCLQVGDLLVFGEGMIPLASSTIQSPSMNVGNANDTSGDKISNLARRHAVRLTSVSASKDMLTGKDVLEIAWDVEDALPFSMCLEKDGIPMSIIYGNVVLADHGLTKTEDLDSTNLLQKNDLRFKESVVGGKYYPWIDDKPLTQCGPKFEAKPGQGGGSAESAFNSSVGNVVNPAIWLLDDNSILWEPAQDLISFDEFSSRFVVETDSDYTSYLRFSEQNRTDWGSQIIDDYANKIQTFKKFSSVTYRIGNGSKGNVGAESITRIVKKPDAPGDFTAVSQLINPIAAKGGADPESVESIRLHAPQAFRKQERAVTAKDYEMVLLRHPEIQRAAAKKRWTGSWYTMFVAVDRKGGLEVDNNFKNEVVAFLEKYRLAGFDIEIQSPIFVPLRISIHVCLKDGYHEGQVKRSLLNTFSSKVGNDGSKGFFHPDNFTFGQALYLSSVYEAAMAVTGVLSVTVNEFHRMGKTPSDEIDKGYLDAGQMEILRLDNDPSFAENGIIDFTFCGGLQDG